MGTACTPGGFGRKVMSEESVSSAGIISSSAGQLLKVSTHETGAMALALRAEPNATEAAPRRSTIQAVRAGKRRPTRPPAVPACWTTSSARTSGNAPTVTERVERGDEGELLVRRPAVRRRELPRLRHRLRGRQVHAAQVGNLGAVHRAHRRRPRAGEATRRQERERAGEDDRVRGSHATSTGRQRASCETWLSGVARVKYPVKCPSCT